MAAPLHTTPELTRHITERIQSILRAEFEAFKKTMHTIKANTGEPVAAKESSDPSPCIAKNVNYIAPQADGEFLYQVNGDMNIQQHFHYNFSPIINVNLGGVDRDHVDSPKGPDDRASDVHKE
ncbi:hypothetical protein NLU13_2710 [Sarocladium strictum]|uniref:Uncharacterized protein n=1 Tax=Sarocladium strictum TaxID=5046 RepID=A0AA39L9Q9_SARSR|nr:hypothetical protein NLU13_2710 [Sarocladium strictum]